MDRLLVDLQKRIDTNTERLKATEKPLFLVEDQVGGLGRGRVGVGWCWGRGGVSLEDV